MKIHYFQRYHEKENVATANTMLLLSRLYSYSPNKFFRFLNSELFSENFEFEPIFTLQERNDSSVPDATITQEGFKIVVETKLTDWFYSEQLMKHLKSFGEAKNKVLVTLASEPMAEKKKTELENLIKEYNLTHAYPVVHINTTFENIARAICEVIDDRDYELQDMVNDYLDYCYNDGLISGADSWKYLRMQLSGTTLDFNVANNVYYDNAERGFRPHDYLGLYKNKCICAIGKVCARIVAIETENGTEYETEFGELTEERKQLIRKAILDGDSRGCNLRNKKHRYFFVDKFYKTNYKKTTPGGCMGTRIFDLSEILEVSEMSDTETIAKALTNKTWG